MYYSGVLAEDVSQCESIQRKLMADGASGANGLLVHELAASELNHPLDTVTAQFLEMVEIFALVRGSDTKLATFG